MGKINAKWLQLDNTSQFNESGNLAVLVDDVSIERSASGLRVKADGINDLHIDWGTGPNQVSAEDVPLADTNNFFSTDNVEAATEALAGKFILYRHFTTSFQNVQAVANNGDTSTNTFDTAIKSIAGHNNGGGNSTTTGVVVNATREYQIPIRDHNTQDPIADSNGNEVYARLSWNSGTSEYIIEYYSMVSGTETAYNGFTTSDHVDLGYVFFSQNFINLPWADVFLTSSWQDVAVSSSTTVLDDNVIVDGMTDLLAGLTTQAQVNAKLDDLGSTANGEGASLIAIEDAANWFSGSDVESALTELESAIGGTNSATRDYTENNVIADNEALVASLDKLDLKWGDLASTNTGEGASLVGIEDNGNYFTSTDVEGALQELAQDIANASTSKTFEIVLTATDIANGYVQLSSQVVGTALNNVVTVDLFNCRTTDGGRADYQDEAIIMRNDAGDTDYLVWLNGVTPPGCTNASSGITSTEFGDLLEANETIQLDATA